MENIKKILFISNGDRHIAKKISTSIYKIQYINFENFKSKIISNYCSIIIDSVLYDKCNLNVIINYLENFKGQIFLLKTNASHYQNIANRIIDTKIDTRPYNNKINAFCNQITKSLNAKTINISSYYFAKKTIGKASLPFELEDEYYVDALNIIIKYLDNKNPELNKSDFSLAISRLLKQKLTIIDKVKFTMNNSKIWKFVCSCDNKFLKKYQNIIIQLSNFDSLSLQTLKNIQNITDENFYKTFEAFIYVSNKNFYNKKIEYEYLFNNKMKILSLKTIIQKLALDKKMIKCKNEINFCNYGYYFANIFEKDVKKYNYTHKNPILIDIWGSCVSRLPFNFDNGNFAVDKYFFQVLPFGLNKTVSYNKNVFIKNHTWQDKILKQVFDCNIIDSIQNHNSKWLVIDIHCLTSKKIYTYKDKIFVDFNQKVSKLLGAKKTTIKDTLQDSIVEKELISFCKLIKKNYQNVILIKNKWQIFYKTDDNKIREFEDSNANFQNNLLVEKYFNIMKDNLQCNVILDVDNFYSSEKSILRNSPVHYEDDFYKTVLNKIKKICLLK